MKVKKKISLTPFSYADDVLLPILFLVAEKLLSDGAIEEHERPIKEAKKI